MLSYFYNYKNTKKLKMTALFLMTAIVLSLSLPFKYAYAQGTMTEVNQNLYTTKDGSYIPLDFLPEQTMIDPDRPIIYVTNPAGQEVISLNYLTGEKKSVHLAYQPERMKIHNNELYVTLPTPKGNYSSEQYGAIGIINLDTFTLVDELPVDSRPDEVIVDHDGYIYVLSRENGDSLTSYSRATKQKIDEARVSSLLYGDILPGQDKIIFLSYTSVSTFHSWTLSQGHFLSENWGNLPDIYYYKSASEDTKIRISPDGKYIFSLGQVYDGLDFLTTLDNDFNDVAFDMENSRFFAAGPDKTITVYDYQSVKYDPALPPAFIAKGSFKVAGTPVEIFYQDNHFISYSNLSNNQSVLEVYTVPDNSLPTSVPKIPADLPNRQIKTLAQIPSSIIPLDFTPKDSLIDPVQPIIYMTDTQAQKVIALNYQTREVKSLKFNYIPEHLKYYNGELYVSLTKGHYKDIHQNLPGAVGIIGTADFELNDLIKVDIDPLDTVPAPNGQIYVFPGYYQDYLQVYARSTKQKVSENRFLYGIARGEMLEYPELDRLYFLNQDSPIDPELFFPGTGAVIRAKRSDPPEYGNYEMYRLETYNKLSPDGKYLFNGSGQIYDSLLNEITRLDSAFTSVDFDLDNKRFFTGESNRIIVMYDYNRLNFDGKFHVLGTMDTVGVPNFVFYRDESLISVSSFNNNNFIEIYAAPPDTLPVVNEQEIDKIADYNPPLLAPLEKYTPQKLMLDFEPADFLLDAEKNLFFADSQNKRLVRIDSRSGAQAFLQFDSVPRQLDFSNGELYVTLEDSSDSKLRSVALVDPRTMLMLDTLSIEDDGLDQELIPSPDNLYRFSPAGEVVNQFSVPFTHLERPFTDIAFDLTNQRFFTAEGFHTINIYDYNLLNLSGSFHSMATFSTQDVTMGLKYSGNTLAALCQNKDGQYLVEIYAIPPGTYPLRGSTQGGQRALLPEGIIDAFPLPETNNLPINSPIVIQFDQNIALGPSASSVVIENRMSQQIPTTLHVSDHVLVILPTTDLGYQTEYHVTIPADSVLAAGQTDQTVLSKDYTFYFSTGAEFNRLGGNDRIETSIKISQAGWETSEYVVMAKSTDFPDALCASPLARKYDAPILLNSPGELEPLVKNELTRLQAKNVIIIGGYGAISQKVEDELRTMGIKLTRIQGDDRYQTSLAIAKNLDPSREVFVATGENFPDVLSIASYAADKEIPILLTQSNQIAESTSKFVEERDVNKAYVVGGEAVVSDSVKNKLPNPVRLAGNDRYETNYAVLSHFELDYSRTFFATGLNFPDALSGSVLAGRSHSPVILVPEQGSQEWSNQWQQKANNMKMKFYLGGDSVVPAATVKSIFAN